MKLGFIGDAHVGNHGQFGGSVGSGVNERGRATLDALLRAREFCEAHEVDVLVSLGDLFHSTHPSPQLIAGVQQALGELPALLLLGNHEMVSMCEGDHALAPLEPVATLVATPRVLVFGDAELWLVPYRPGKASEWLPEDVAAIATKVPQLADGQRVLCLHLGISDSATPYYLDGADDSVSVVLLDELARRFGITHTIAGNWHRRRLWNRDHATHLQVGALCPTGFANPGVRGYGTVAVLDGPSLQITELPGPRFVKCPSIAACRNAVRDGEEMGLYIHASVEPAEYDDAVALLADWRASSTIVAGKVDIVATDTAHATSEAIERVRAASGSEAVVLYVNALDLPPGVSHVEVAQRCKEFLAP